MTGVFFRIQEDHTHRVYLNRKNLFSISVSNYFYTDVSFVLNFPIIFPPLSSAAERMCERYFLEIQFNKERMLLIRTMHFVEWKERFSGESGTFMASSQRAIAQRHCVCANTPTSAQHFILLSCASHIFRANTPYFLAHCAKGGKCLCKANNLNHNTPSKFILSDYSTK